MYLLFDYLRSLFDGVLLQIPNSIQINSIYICATTKPYLIRNQFVFPGRSHDNTFALYHLGQRATDGVKQFAETGKSDILENLTSKPRKQSSAKMKAFSSYQQNDLDKSSNSINDDSTSKWNKKNPIFDDFTLPPITTGSGRSESKFFVDGNHSHVSLMTKILPSPDWFIGVDSFQVRVFLFLLSSQLLSRVLQDF